MLDDRDRALTRKPSTTRIRRECRFVLSSSPVSVSFFNSSQYVCNRFCAFDVCQARKRTLARRSGGPTAWLTLLTTPRRQSENTLQCTDEGCLALSKATKLNASAESVPCAFSSFLSPSAPGARKEERCRTQNETSNVHGKEDPSETKRNRAYQLLRLRTSRRLAFLTILARRPRRLFPRVIQLGSFALVQTNRRLTSLSRMRDHLFFFFCFEAFDELEPSRTVTSFASPRYDTPTDDQDPSDWNDNSQVPKIVSETTDANDRLTSPRGAKAHDEGDDSPMRAIV